MRTQTDNKVISVYPRSGDENKYAVVIPESDFIITQTSPHKTLLRPRHQESPGDGIR
jgi:hypothetical protein